MVIRTYGKWIPDSSVVAGYKPINDWSSHLQLQHKVCPNFAQKTLKNDPSEESLFINHLLSWRPQGESNPCYRRERAMS
jgi:hypothetical protein